MTLRVSIFFLSGLLSLKIYSAQTSSQRYERVIGNIIKNSLETYHYRRIKIDDHVSGKAFKKFLEKLDYGKQFLLDQDVKRLGKYTLKMDDQMVSGNHQLIDLVMFLMKKRIEQAEKLREKIFNTEFSFTTDETLELDPEKRAYPKTRKEWNNHWRRIYKHAVLNHYFSLLENDKDKKKGDKKVTDKQLRKDSHKAVSEKYKDIFQKLAMDDREDYLEKFFNSIANVFDPHTSYLPPKKKEEFDIDLSGQLEGIGAQLEEDGPYTKVIKVLPGGAAWRQRELEVGDIILMVGQKDKVPVNVVGMRIDDVIRYIRGKKGTEVRLTVKKVSGSRKVISIIRDVVKTEAAFAKSSVIEHKAIGTKIGYIYLPKFYRNFNNPSKNCSQDVLFEIERLKKVGVEGIILDLRNNGGGALPDAQTISGFFLPSGPIVQTKNYTSKIDVLRDQDGKTSFNGPLIVMVNRFSASASEILAGALQDYKRAVIVGGKYTHGKGTVQAVLPLNAGIMRQLFGDQMGALKVTIQKFYRISGVSTQNKGITPDIIIPDPLEYFENREKDLDYGLPWDAVKEENFSKWPHHQYKMETLRKRSAMRVVNNPRFKKIKKLVHYLIERKKDTVATLNLKKVKIEDKKNKEISKALKLDEKDEKISVSYFSASLRRHEKIVKTDIKRWEKDFAQRKEDWTNRIRQDPAIEETLFIIDDMIRQVAGKKLTHAPPPKKWPSL